MGVLLRPIFNKDGKVTVIQRLDSIDAMVYHELGYKQPWPKKGILYKFMGLFSLYDKVVYLNDYKGNQDVE